MDTSIILEEQVGDRLLPLRIGGITLYPAEELGTIFNWAQRAGRTLEWIEGAFYDPEGDQGQHSLNYMCERGPDYEAFKARCLSFVPEIEAEAAAIGMGAYFEIGITPPNNGR